MKEKMTALLQEKFQPVKLDVVDDSAKHAGHAGAIESGGGHYQVLIVSAAFDGATPIERHRMVYRTLNSLKPHIHALGIRTYTPKEYELRP